MSRDKVSNQLHDQKQFSEGATITTSNGVRLKYLFISLFNLTLYSVTNVNVGSC